MPPAVKPVPVTVTPAPGVALEGLAVIEGAARRVAGGAINARANSATMKTTSLRSGCSFSVGA